jgi:hypothetical protein
LQRAPGDRHREERSDATIQDHREAVGARRLRAMKASKSNGVDLRLLSPSTSAARSAANLAPPLREGATPRA